MESHKIVSVRPTRSGDWEVVETTLVEDRKWQKEWAAWWRIIGERMWLENPNLWKE